VPPPESTNMFTLYNLQADTEYEFQVYASNRLGAGLPTQPIRASTKSMTFNQFEKLWISFHMFICAFSVEFWREDLSNRCLWRNIHSHCTEAFRLVCHPEMHLLKLKQNDTYKRS